MLALLSTSLFIVMTRVLMVVQLRKSTLMCLSLDTA